MTLGNVGKASYGSFAGKRKLLIIPYVVAVQDSPELVEMVQSYWKDAVAQVLVVFACSRVAGWTAHVREQYADNRLIRPDHAYVGPDARKQVSIHLFGYESDLFRVELLFTSLLLQASSRLAGTTAPPYESLAAYRRSWLAGFTAAVTQRLRAAEEQAGRAAEAAQDEERPRGRSVALVLVDRSRAVAEAVDGEYPHLRTAATRSLSGSGGASGWAAGQRADLGGRPVSRDGRRRIAG